MILGMVMIFRYNVKSTIRERVTVWGVRIFSSFLVYGSLWKRFCDFFRFFYR